MTDLEANPPEPVSIVNITSSGGTMSVHLSDGSIAGPLRLPTASFYVHGPWQPGLAYALNDVFHHDNATYIVRVAHTSNPTFDPGRTSGGESVYQVMTYGFEFRGPWQPGTAYRAYDFVRDAGGSVYIVRHDHESAASFDAGATTVNNEPLYELVFAAYVPPVRYVTIGAAVSGKAVGQSGHSHSGDARADAGGRCDRLAGQCRGGRDGADRYHDRQERQQHRHRALCRGSNHRQLRRCCRDGLSWRATG